MLQHVKKKKRMHDNIGYSDSSSYFYLSPFDGATVY